GVSLRITPRIEGREVVRSNIEVEVSSIDPALSIPTGPSLKTRRAATEFNVRSGQTLVLAGFLSREMSENVDAIPGLGSIPILGELFRSTRYQKRETELAIFVTPHVVGAEQSQLGERVQKGRAHVQMAFPDPPVMNVPIDVEKEHIPAPAWANSQYED
ncbi:MAG TPA: secretion protein, partial [Pusillimonas sp.]|nr:secretion protein [Pusillimonas sp.]